MGNRTGTIRAYNAIRHVKSHLSQNIKKERGCKMEDNLLNDQEIIDMINQCFGQNKKSKTQGSKKAKSK